METLIEGLLAYGLPGIFIGWLMLDIYAKSQRISTLTDKLVEKSGQDAAQFAGITLTMERILMVVQGGVK